MNGDNVINQDDWDIVAKNQGINLQNVWILGDLDGDFDVDEFDVNTLANNFFMSNPTRTDGDLNGDGAVNDADVDLIFAQYGLDLEVVS